MKEVIKDYITKKNGVNNMKYMLEDYPAAFLFAYGKYRKTTIERMNRFCEATNLNAMCEFGTVSDDIKDVKQEFSKLIYSIDENGLGAFLVVESLDSILIGFKEMEQLYDLIERREIIVWCLDEHALLVNPEKAN